MGLTGRQATELMSELNSSQLLHLEGRSSSQTHNDGAFVEVISDQSAEPEAEVLASAEVDALQDAMAALGTREHTVVYLSFFGGLTQEQIGLIIGVGGPQVCKIHGAALRKLRSILGPSRERAGGGNRQLNRRTIAVLLAAVGSRPRSSQASRTETLKWTSKCVRQGGTGACSTTSSRWAAGFPGLDIGLDRVANDDAGKRTAGDDDDPRRQSAPAPGRSRNARDTGTRSPRGGETGRG